MSMGVRRSFIDTVYSTITAAIPETIAENRNTTGINGVDHQGLAFTEPKMKPT